MTETPGGSRVKNAMPIGRIMLVLISVAIVALGKSAPAQGTSTAYWFGDGGPWSNPAHWVCLVAGKEESEHCVPDASMATFIPYALATLDTTANVLDLSIYEGGALQIPPGTHITAARNLAVGQAGLGTLTINRGSATGNRIFAGWGLGSTGNVTVAGFGATLRSLGDLSIGVDGRATLTVDDSGFVRSAPICADCSGAFIGYAAGSEGTVRLSRGSQWVNTGIMEVGTDGRGNVNVATGAKIDTGGLILGTRGTSTGEIKLESGGVLQGVTGILGYAPGTRGTVSVGGATSRWMASDFLTVGNNGTGLLTVDAGGEVSSGAGYVGWGTGSSGEVKVSGSSRWTATQSLHVGYNGVGTMTLESGDVASNAGLFLGWDTTGNGTLNVKGASSKTLSDFVTVGNRGLGFLNVETGGKVEVRAAASSPGLYVGYFGGSKGQVNVAGGGSRLSAGFAEIGLEGEASLVVRDGGAAAFGTVRNTREVVVAGASSLTATGNYTQMAGGRTTVLGAAVLSAPMLSINGGIVTGDGRLAATTVIAAGAALMPGNHEGSGDLEVSAGLGSGSALLLLRGNLVAPIGPLGAARVAVGGSIRLDETTSDLQIQAPAGYDPPAGTRLVIATATVPVTGRFKSILNAAIGDTGKLWRVEYNSGGNNIVLFVTCSAFESSSWATASEPQQCGLPKATIVMELSLMRPSRLSRVAPFFHPERRAVEISCRDAEGTFKACSWRLRVSSTADSDAWSGHLGGWAGPHSARPLGWLSFSGEPEPPNSPAPDLHPKLEGIEADGEFASVIYTAHAAAGRAVLIVDCPDDSCMESDAVTIEIGQSGFAAVTAGPHLTLGDTMHHGKNHFVRAADKDDYAELWSQVNAELIARGVPVDLVPQKFIYSAFSLPRGGLYDYKGDWAPPHLDHRDGNNADLDAFRSGFWDGYYWPDIDRPEEAVLFRQVFKEVIERSEKFHFISYENPDTGEKHWHLVHD